MIPRSRINHWSCSKAADFLRGIKKPLALTFEEWDLWREECKSKSPIRYWLAEKFLTRLQNIVYFPADLYHTIRIYVRNRWIDKIHYIKTGLQPGEYYDLDHRILHGLFNELVDFVEIEYAHLSKWNNENKYKFVKGRCKEAGIDYLNWAIGLTYGQDCGVDESHPDFGKPTHQAITAKKTLELYDWWKNKRPNRIDPYKLFKKQEDEGHYLKIDDMEKNYDEEDTFMLIELIKIRKGLWT